MKRPLKVLVAEVTSIFAQGQKDFESGKGNQDGSIKAEPSLRGELYNAYTEDAHAFKELLAENELRLFEVPNSDGQYGMASLAIDNFYLEKEGMPLTMVFYTAGEEPDKTEEKPADDPWTKVRGVEITSVAGRWLYGVKQLLGAS